MYVLLVFFLFFFKQKTAYEMRISDWSSDVCSSDLFPGPSRPTKRWRLTRMWRSSGGNSGSVPATGQCCCCFMAADCALAKRWARQAKCCRLAKRVAARANVESTASFRWAPTCERQLGAMWRYAPGKERERGGK